MHGKQQIVTEMWSSTRKKYLQCCFLKDYDLLNLSGEVWQTTRTMLISKNTHPDNIDNIIYFIKKITAQPE